MWWKNSVICVAFNLGAKHVSVIKFFYVHWTVHMYANCLFLYNLCVILDTFTSVAIKTFVFIISIIMIIEWMKG